MNNNLIEIDKTKLLIFLQILNERVNAEFIASIHVKISQ